MSELAQRTAHVHARRGDLLSSWRFQRSAVAAAQHTVLVSAAVIILLPLFWTISTSLKEPTQVYAYPPEWLPSPARWSNYVEAMTVVPFLRFFANTALITVLNIVGQLLACSLAAFAFARLRWWGRNTLFVLMISTMMLPYQVTLIPQFILFRTLGWVNTFLPLIVPRLFAGAFYTFLMRQFFMTIPAALDDAARIDGATTFGIYYRIILPMSKPVLMAVSIFVFNFSWNEFLMPLIYLSDQKNLTISLGLRSFQNLYSTQWHLLMAASTVAMLPVILIFFVGQRYFIQGVVFSGVKG